jgi:O-antigen chain-terminating methyltransferase
MGMKPPNQPDRPKPGVDIDALMEQMRAEIGEQPVSEQGVVDPAESAVGRTSTPVLSTDEIMARVRAEVARRRAGHAASDGADSVSSPVPCAVREHLLPHWQPAAARLPDQAQYVLSDFLRFNDADFVEVAYEKLLRRPADPEGSQGYLSALRSGALGKVEILGLIRFSTEGRRQAVHVDGLLLPYKLHRLRHVRVIGWFLGFGMAIWRLPRLAWRLQGMEASAAHEAQETGRLLGLIEDAVERRFASMDGIIDTARTELAQAAMSRVEGLRVVAVRVGALRAALESTSNAIRNGKAELHGEVESLSAALQASDAEHASQRASVEAALAAHEMRHAELAEAMDALDAGNAERLRDHREATARLTVHDAALARLEEQTRSDHRALRAVLDRLTVFLDASARKAGKVSEGRDDKPSLEEQYASFEQTFRGEREQIKLRAMHYLNTLAGAGIEPGDEGVVLDLGSGRGEWLEVLAEHGYHGRGVDSNRGVLKASEARGHEVVEADALDYLRAQPGGSFAAITSMHMVEHMPHPVVIRLLDEALRALRPGGVLILETPNPENVLVGSCMFYMDPTHLHPIPPPLLQWTVQTRGFEQVEIERLSESRGSSDLKPVSDEVPGAAQINQMVAWFTAPPDYAVIARKPV